MLSYSRLDTNLHRIGPSVVWDPSSVEEEDGGEENRLLKLTKQPVPTSDAPEQVEDDPSGDVKLIWRMV